MGGLPAPEPAQRHLLSSGLGAEKQVEKTHNAVRNRAQPWSGHLQSCALVGQLTERGA